MSIGEILSRGSSRDLHRYRELHIAPHLHRYSGVLFFHRTTGKRPKIGREMASSNHMIDFACGLFSANLQENQTMKLNVS